MQLVYCKISVPLVDELPGFWRKLKKFIGQYRIEPHGIDEWVDNSTIMISFYTDKIQLKEGDRRMVELIAKTDESGDWNFMDINKI